MAGPTGCEARWKEVLTSFNSQANELLSAHPDAREEIELVHTALVTIGQLVQAAPRVNAIAWCGCSWQTEPRPRESALQTS
jgi:hypothetical protein